MGWLALALLIAVVGGGLAAGGSYDTERRNIGQAWGAGIAVALIVLLANVVWHSLVVIDTGHVGVVTRFGAITGRNMDPGFQTKVPFFDDVTVFDTRVQKEQVNAEAASKDLQEVKATIAVNYRLDATNASTVFQVIGADYKVRVVDPAIQEAFKASTAQYTAEELITQREVVKMRALEVLQEKLAKFHVKVDELNIVNFDFSKSFNEAVERKQVAQQDVGKAKQELDRIKVEAEQRITEAKAQAESQKLQQATITDKYLQLLAIQKWDGKMPNVIAGGDVPFILGKLEGEQATGTAK